VSKLTHNLLKIKDKKLDPSVQPDCFLSLNGIGWDNKKLGTDWPFVIDLTGKCSASPALWAGSRGTIKMRFHFREAPACGRGASHLNFEIWHFLNRPSFDLEFVLFERRYRWDLFGVPSGDIVEHLLDPRSHASKEGSHG
jgi:hypothetical protein